jgi:hypothetical protein
VPDLIKRRYQDRNIRVGHVARNTQQSHLRQEPADTSEQGAAYRRLLGPERQSDIERFTDEIDTIRSNGRFKWLIISDMRSNQKKSRSYSLGSLVYLLGRKASFEWISP